MCNEWQDIETAPKDGSEFIAIFNGGKPTIAFWTGRGFKWIDPKQEPRWPETCLRNLFKVWPQYQTDSGTSFWMPLPAPPEVSNA